VSSPATTSSAAPATQPRRSWTRHDLAAPFLIYAVSRLVVVIAGQISLWVNRGLSWDTFFSQQWDAGWYMKVVHEGYPRHIPPGGIPASQTTLAFFPGYPALIRAGHWLTRLPDAWVGLIIAMVGGAVAAALLWLLAAHVTDRTTATRAVALFCFAPSAFVFSLTYSEGLFLAASVACIYALVRRRWTIAGLAAAVASASRPPGVLLAAACTFAALVELRRTRDWRALAAPLLAPAGAAAYAVYLKVHTGSVRSYQQTLADGWGQRLDFGKATYHRLGPTLHAPWDHPLFFLNFVTIVVVAVAIGLLLYYRLPYVLPVTVVALFIPALVSSSPLSTPRYAMAAFPIFVALARAARGVVFALVLLLSASLMVGLTIGSASHVFIP
jgi:hypothetical protein